MDDNVAAFAAWLKGMVTEEGSDEPKKSSPEDDDGSSSSSSPPVAGPSFEDMDKLLAEELNQMKLEDREQVYEEIHGVDKIVEETPELLVAKVEEIAREISKISEKPAYLQAERQCSEYVNSRKLRLMFLRAEYFDARKAAIRMVKFFEHKLELYGADALARPLRLSDMDEDDLACLKAGSVQILPVRDRAGRIVFCDLQKPYAPAYKTVQNMLKTIAFIILNAAEDEESQKRGMVGLLYHVGPMPIAGFDRELFYKGPSSVFWLPIRMVGLHYCFDDQLIRAVVAFTMMSVGKEVRAKFRLHDGTHTECQYSLMTFGIPTKFLPVTYDGTLKTDNHRKWIAKQKSKESVVKKYSIKGRPYLDFEGIDIPGTNDVLLGRGKPIQEHSGNVKLLSLIDVYRGEYDGTNGYGQKAVLAEKIVKIVQTEHQGRFLKVHPDHGWWVEVSQVEAIDKVTHSFRTTRASGSRTSYFATKDGNRKRMKKEEPETIMSVEQPEKGCLQANAKNSIVWEHKCVIIIKSTRTVHQQIPLDPADGLEFFDAGPEDGLHAHEY